MKVVKVRVPPCWDCLCLPGGFLSVTESRISAGRRCSTRDDAAPCKGRREGRNARSSRREKARAVPVVPATLTPAKLRLSGGRGHGAAAGDSRCRRVGRGLHRGTGPPPGDGASAGVMGPPPGRRLGVRPAGKSGPRNQGNWRLGLGQEATRRDPGPMRGRDPGQ